MEAHDSLGPPVQKEKGGRVREALTFCWHFIKLKAPRGQIPR